MAESVGGGSDDNFFFRTVQNYIHNDLVSWGINWVFCTKKMFVRPIYIRIFISSCSSILYIKNLHILLMNIGREMFEWNINERNASEAYILWNDVEVETTAVAENTNRYFQFKNLLQHVQLLKTVIFILSSRTLHNTLLNRHNMLHNHILSNFFYEAIASC